MNKPFVCLLTGPPGVGKSTIAQNLAEALPRSVRLNVDAIRHMVIGGQLHPFPATEESEQQLLLAEENTLALATNFTKAGYTVFIDDIVLEPQKLGRFVASLKEIPFYSFLLICDLEELIKRDATRPLDEQMGERSVELHQQYLQLKEDLDFSWTIVNSSGQSPQQTSQYIFDLLHLSK